MTSCLAEVFPGKIPGHAGGDVLRVEGRAQLVVGRKGVVPRTYCTAIQADNGRKLEKRK